MEDNKNYLIGAIERADSIAISGHVRPDGDAIGSSMGLYYYLADNYPEKTVCVFLEDVPDSFAHIRDEDAMTRRMDHYDLFIALDSGDVERLGDAGKVMQNDSDYIINIDHHITNTLFGNKNIVDAKASSTCQILFTLMDEEKISKLTAMALYTGIIHDTGVFKHSNTSYQTMRIAGKLMRKGIAFGEIIDNSFYNKTYKQLQIMGRCLTESVRVMDGLVIFAVMRLKDMEFYGAKPSDLDGVIDELRTTEGVEVAILLSERAPDEFKVSMRSNQVVDVASIAKYYGGGGHIKASGCTMQGSSYDVINALTAHIENQLGVQEPEDEEE
ncbi:MAG TPA: DHH family phosphoesterase [Lachnospiraceae bacterium]|nr:bifunctional oligoribonuclease/PAP phosphatase NrnA [Eubacterium sp.]HAK58622.1 DHH family phosphoesterase [Lachnospiraceae bacterium]